MTVGLELARPALRIEVSDSSTRTGRAAVADEERESGRGLALVAALSHDSGSTCHRA